MGDFVVGLREIADSGVTFPSDGSHVIRIAGARRTLQVVPTAMKEEVKPIAEPAVFDQFYRGELRAPGVSDATADLTVASELYVTESGEVLPVPRNLAWAQ